MPCAANRTFSKVKSRAMSPRQPEVPNLIEVTPLLSADGPRISSRSKPFLPPELLSRIPDPTGGVWESADPLESGGFLPNAADGIENP